ncbi:MAG: TGS domain-containing protein [archaeon]|nr:TGS domain-containing protein [archaeon]
MAQASRKSFLESFSKEFGTNSDATKAIDLVESHGVESDSKRAIEVAMRLLELNSTKEVVLTGILHNSEELGIAAEKIRKDFGQRVAEMCDLNARFKKALLFKPEDRENARKKMLVVLATNPETVIIQLCETIVKLKDAQSLPEKERRALAEQANEVYAPLAHKIGIYSISAELGDYAYKYLEPKEYARMEKAINEIASNRSEDIEHAKKRLKHELKTAGIECNITGRLKSISSTNAKIKRKRVPLSEIYDIIAIRVIAESIKDCYEILGIVHSIWKPIAKEFDDYIAKPKENGYMSLHTTVAVDKHPLEIQIRTKKMHDAAEYGIASHWKYKGGKYDSKYDKKIEWMKQVLDWQKSTGEKTQANIFGKEIFALTPNGQVIELPEGATAIDFAYAVHSDIGNKCQSAKINGKIAQLNTAIQNGDIVEIITSNNQVPKMAWLSFAKTSKAKQKIRAKLQLQQQAGHKKMQGQSKKGHAIKMSDQKIRLGKCCNPLPGDDIVGFRTTKRKISVHRADCPQATQTNTHKVDVMWHSQANIYDAEITVKAEDRIGLLKDLLDVLSSGKVPVNSANARTSHGNIIMCKFGLKIKDVAQLEAITKKLAGVNGVNAVYRQ